MDRDRPKPDSRQEEAGYNGRSDGGESAGGAYPNPHSGKEEGESGGFMGHGGQTQMAYHGHGQLGHQDVEGLNPNAPAGADEAAEGDEDESTF